MNRPTFVLLGGVLAGFVFVEAVLQVGALWVVWNTNRSRAASIAPSKSGHAGRVVLCVGDSFTFGSGASTPEMSYPGQLSAILRTAGDDPKNAAWRVVNAGWPGRNSSELLASLPELLDRESPRDVCVLVGQNDRWNREGGSRAERDAVREADANTPGRWRWRWRTKRLAEIVAQSIRDRRSAARQAQTAPSPSPIEEPRIDSPLAAIDRALEDPATANDARRTLAALDDSLHATTDVRFAAEIVRLLAKAGLRTEAAKEGLAAIERLGGAAPLAREVVPPLARLGRFDEAMHWAHEAVRLEPDDASNWRALNLAGRLGGEPARAMEALARGFAIDGDEAYLMRQLRRRGFARVLPLEEVRRLSNTLPIADEPRARFVAIVEECRVEAPFEAALRENLASIVRAVRAKGARPVLLTYPHGGTPTPIDLVLAETAEEFDTTLVDLVPVFNEAEESHPKEELYVPDGHCSDRGYGIVAARVASALRAQE